MAYARQWLPKAGALASQAAPLGPTLHGSGAEMIRNCVGEALAPRVGAAAGCMLAAARGMAKTRRHNQPPRGAREPNLDQEKQIIDENMDTFFSVVCPTPRTPPERTPEDLEKDTAYAKQYSRYKMSMHRRHQEVLNLKIRLQQQAIAALPKELQAAAMIPDLTPFPLKRSIPTNTPPHTEEEIQRAKEASGEMDAGTMTKRR